MIVIIKRSHDKESKPNSFIIGFFARKLETDDILRNLQLCVVCFPTILLDEYVYLFYKSYYRDKFCILKWKAWKRRKNQTIWLILKIIERMIIKTWFLMTWLFYINYWIAMFHWCISIVDPLHENLESL